MKSSAFHVLVSLSYLVLVSAAPTPSWWHGQGRFGGYPGQQHPSTTHLVPGGSQYPYIQSHTAVQHVSQAYLPDPVNNVYAPRYSPVNGQQPAFVGVPFPQRIKQKGRFDFLSRWFRRKSKKDSKKARKVENARPRMDIDGGMPQDPDPEAHTSTRIPKRHSEQSHVAMQQLNDRPEWSSSEEDDDDGSIEEEEDIRQFAGYHDSQEFRRRQQFEVYRSQQSQFLPKQHTAPPLRRAQTVTGAQVPRSHYQGPHVGHNYYASQTTHPSRSYSTHSVHRHGSYNPAHSAQSLAQNMRGQQQYNPQNQHEIYGTQRQHRFSHMPQSRPGLQRHHSGSYNMRPPLLQMSYSEGPYGYYQQTPEQRRWY